MFKPKYIISDLLLSHIKQIGILVNELNHKTFPDVILMRLEKNANQVSSFASTSIEGNPLPLTDVKRILKNRPEKARQSEIEILNYNKALEKLNRKIKKGKVRFDKRLILNIHKEVVESLLPESQTGKFRQEPVAVNNPKTGEPIYLPPDHKQVEKLVSDLVSFINENKKKIDPLVLSGLFHKQFVIIHPFMDGNGRTTRLAVKALLADMGLNTFNLFSFENYYNQNVSGYFKKVGVFGNYYDMIDQVDFTQWLEYFTEGIIDELLRVKKTLAVAGASPDTELKPYHQKILDLIAQKGFIADRDYAKLTDRAKATRALDFQKLIKLGLIIRLGKGRAIYYKLK